MHSFLAVLLGCFASAAAGDAEAMEEECPVLLLQTSAGLQRQSVAQPAAEDARAAQAARLEAALPFVYMHVPKTGSSITNAFVRLPGACTELFLEELGDDSFHTGNDDYQFERFRDTSICERLAPPPITPDRFWGCHDHLGDDDMVHQHYDGHGVTMLRQPEQRVISGLRHMAGGMAGAEGVPIELLQPSDGCTARLLSGDDPIFRSSDTFPACFGRGRNEDPIPPVPEADVAKAVERLQRFAFVGIQEEWHLSVCLLHTMFGGECHNVEFMNTRASGWSSGNFEPVFEAPVPYDTSILGGWVDAADRAVYDAGLEIFHSQCEEHGVSMDSCRPCFETAGLL